MPIKTIEVIEDRAEFDALPVGTVLTDEDDDRLTITADGPVWDEYSTFGADDVDNCFPYEVVSRPEAPTFQRGDRVRISDDPGVGEVPGSGYVSPQAAGQSGNVDYFDGECHLVRGMGSDGKEFAQYVHSNHLTLVEDDEEGKPESQVVTIEDAPTPTPALEVGKTYVMRTSKVGGKFDGLPVELLSLDGGLPYLKPLRDRTDIVGDDPRIGFYWDSGSEAEFELREPEPEVDDEVDTPAPTFEVGDRVLVSDDAISGMGGVSNIHRLRGEVVVVTMSEPDSDGDIIVKREGDGEVAYVLPEHLSHVEEDAERGEGEGFPKFNVGDRVRRPEGVDHYLSDDHFGTGPTYNQESDGKVGEVVEVLDGVTHSGSRVRVRWDGGSRSVIAHRSLELAPENEEGDPLDEPLAGWERELLEGQADTVMAPTFQVGDIVECIEDDPESSYYKHRGQRGVVARVLAGMGDPSEEGALICTDALPGMFAMRLRKVEAEVGERPNPLAGLPTVHDQEGLDALPVHSVVVSTRGHIVPFHKRDEGWFNSYGYAVTTDPRNTAEIANVFGPLLAVLDFADVDALRDKR